MWVLVDFTPGISIFQASNSKALHECLRQSDFFFFDAKTSVTFSIKWEGDPTKLMTGSSIFEKKRKKLMVHLISLNKNIS